MFTKFKWRVVRMVWEPGMTYPTLTINSFPENDDKPFTKNTAELEMLHFVAENGILQLGLGTYTIIWGEEPELREMDVYERIDYLEKFTRDKTMKEVKDVSDKKENREPAKV